MDKLIYFIRHGESTANAEGKCGGQLDSPLTALGKEQASAVAPLIADVCFDRVYCSDLARAKETAAIALPHVTPLYLPLLREICCGEKAEGVTRSELIKIYGEEYPKAASTRDYSFFGGESYADFAARVAAFKEMLEGEDATSIAVFGHGGFIQEFFRQAMGVPQIVPQRIPLRNCGVSVFGVEGGVWSLCAYNVTASFRANKKIRTEVV